LIAKSIKRVIVLARTWYIYMDFNFSIGAMLINSFGIWTIYENRECLKKPKNIICFLLQEYSFQHLNYFYFIYYVYQTVRRKIHTNLSRKFEKNI